MPRLALLAITGGVVVPEPEEPPEEPELPEELPAPLELPDPALPLEPVELLDPPLLLDPLEPPELDDPLVELDVPDVAALSPLLPPQATTASATVSASIPLRTGDLFILYQYLTTNTVVAHEVQSICHRKHSSSRTTDVMSLRDGTRRRKRRLLVPRGAMTGCTATMRFPSWSPAGPCGINFEFS